jgi:hypothetical protein
VGKANVAVGIPWRDGKPDPERGDEPMHGYFPTDDRLGRSLLVHGDFYVQSNRRRITSTGRGAEVRRIVAGAAAELTAELAVALAPHGSALRRTLASTGTPDGSTPNGCSNHYSYLVSRRGIRCRFLGRTAAAL